MATESRLATRQPGEPELFSPVENEIPTYRAITPLAIASLLFGLASFLCFASSGFLFASAMAVVFGFLALLRIKRQPEVLTGRGFAQTGIALGLICGLSSTTYSFTQDYLLRTRAEKFMRGELMPILQERDLNGALWYKAPPDRRRSMTPEQVRKAMDNPSAPGTAYLETQAGGLVRLMRELETWPGATLEFRGIEKTGLEETTPVVVALIHIDWPPADAASPPKDEDHDHAAGEAHTHDHAPSAAAAANRGELAAFLIKSSRQGRTTGWWAEECLYPYQPDSFKPKVKPVDDGHGH